MKSGTTNRAAAGMTAKSRASRPAGNRNTNIVTSGSTVGSPNNKVRSTIKSNLKGPYNA